MKLLVIEDEPKTASFLKKGFVEQGFVVDTVHNGEDGLHMATTESYDCIILDVQLPTLDGWTVIVQIRQNSIKTPVIFLTARDGITDRVKGLELGADDYLVKPFAFSELLARVRTILRRGTSWREDVLSFQDLTLDLHRHTALRGNLRLDLTPQEFRLLSFFLRHPNEVLSRTLISEQVWDMHFDSDTNVVDVAIRRLRNKVDSPFDLKLIHTIRGVGYVLGER